MITIVSTPDCTNSIYAPIKFVFDVTFTLVSDSYSSMEVKLLIEDVEKRTLNLPPISSSQSNGEITNRFEVNVSEILQLEFENSASLPAFSSTYNTVLPRRYKKWRIKAFSYEPSVDGKLTIQEDQYNSPTYKSINAIDLPNSNCLEQYFDDTGRLFLTNRLRNRAIPVNGSEFLSFARCEENLTYRVTTFDYTNSQLQQSFIPATDETGNGFIGRKNDIHTLAVAPNYLSGNTPISGPVLDFTNVSHYTIQVQNALGTIISEKFTFYIDRDFCDFYEIIFLNPFGEYDTLYIKNDELITYNAQSATYQDQDSERKLFTVINESFSGQIINTWKGQADWLKFLALSVDVKIRYPDTGIIDDVVINDAESKLRDEYERVDFFVTGRLSVALRSHRN